MYCLLLVERVSTPGRVHLPNTNEHYSSFTAVRGEAQARAWGRGVAGDLQGLEGESLRTRPNRSPHEQQPAEMSGGEPLPLI